jgi:hypothetical protein
MYCVNRGQRMYHDPFKTLACEQINEVSITSFTRSFARAIHIDALNNLQKR